MTHDKNPSNWPPIFVKYGYSVNVSNTRKDKTHIKIFYNGFLINKIDTKSTRNNTVGTAFIGKVISCMRKGIQRYEELSFRSEQRE